MNFTKKYYNSYLKEKWGASVDTLKFYDDDSFYVKCYDKTGKMTGQVRIGLNITPGTLSKANPVGQGRTEPNHSPFLPPPVGRISFTLNPFTMLNQLVGPELRKKIYGYCCLILCILFCVLMFPMVFSNIISQMIVKVF